MISFSLRQQNAHCFHNAVKLNKLHRVVRVMRNIFGRDRRDVAARRGLRAPPVVFVPGEDVLLLPVPLPPMPSAQRRTAVAFAVEDRIARPLDEVHVILGPALPDPPGHWLVAVIARDVLAAHLARLRPGPGVRVLPDTLSLPVPPAGHWAAREEAGRVILRLADGTGMVIMADMLAALHVVAGSPGIVLHGGVLPDGFGQPPTPIPSPPRGGEAHGDAGLPLPTGGRDALTTPPAPPLPRVGRGWGVRRRQSQPHQGAVLFPLGPDLRTASREVGITGLPRLLVRVAAVAGLAALVHLVLLGAETVVLSQRLAAREVALRAGLSQAGLAPEGDVEATLARALTQRQGTGEPAGFLPLLSAAMAAMAPLAGQATLRDLRYGGAGGDLVMTVQAADLGTLQAVETSLAGADLRVGAGTATTADGLAEQQLTVAR